MTQTKLDSKVEHISDVATSQFVPVVRECEIDRIDLGISEKPTKSSIGQEIVWQLIG